MKKSAASKRSRHNGELRQWANAVVKKATPNIVRSLTQAAESLAKPVLTHHNEPVAHAPEEPQDESLAALLLRLLQAGENTGEKNVAAKRVASVTENPSLVE